MSGIIDRIRIQALTIEELLRQVNNRLAYSPEYGYSAWPDYDGPVQIPENWPNLPRRPW